jgi:hypothetical protein
MLLTRSLAPSLAPVLNARSHSPANSNTEIREPFRDASRLDGIGKVKHQGINAPPITGGSMARRARREGVGQ